jgi:hypothetical protein
MKTYGGVETVTLFLTSELDGDEWSALRLGRFTPEKELPLSHWN